MSADGADGDGGTKQRFELYIKASAIDKETKGSCPMCQHWFMITCVLGENQDDIDFKVYTVQADCPPKNFGVEQGWSKKFPVIMVLEGRDKRGQDLSGTKYDTFEELEVFFESINRKCPALKRKNAPNVAAMAAVDDVYNAFNISLPSGKENKRLASALKKMNDFLEEDSDCKFLVDNVLSFADCYILPRLQHIRVAGKAYMSYDIPDKYTAIWKYLADAYQTEAFRSTMPSNQDIVFHYEKKVGHLLKDKKLRYRPTLQSFTYTLDVPEDIALLLQSSGAEEANGDAAHHPAPVEDMAAMDVGHRHHQHEAVTIPVSHQQHLLEEEEEEEVTVSVSHQQVEEVAAPPVISRQEEEEEEMSASHQQVEESLPSQQEEVSFSQQQVDEVSSSPREEISVSQQQEEEIYVNQQQEEEISVGQSVEDTVQVSFSQPEETGVSQEISAGGDGDGEDEDEAVYVNVGQRASPVVCEAPPPVQESTVEVVVTSEEGVLTRASPPPPPPEDDDDVGGVTVAAAADDDGHAKNGTDDTPSVAVDGQAISPDTNGEKEVDNDAEVSEAVGVKITVTQDGDDSDVKREVGNGEVVKDLVSKDEVINTNEGTASASQ